jgi:hypothetical protein
MKRVDITVPFEKWEKIPRGVDSEEAKSYRGRAGDTCKDNIARFYVHLYTSMFGGDILKEGQTYSHAYPLFNSNGHEFRPDVLVKKGMAEESIEIKAICRNHGKPWFGAQQFLGYCKSFLEPYSNVTIGIFNYGGREPEKLHVCKKNYACERRKVCSNRCLTERLSHSTNSLIVMPHNLATFIMALSKVESMDQTSSQSTINSADYFRPYGHWLSTLQKEYKNPDKAITDILSDKKLDQKRTLEILPKQEDYLLNSLTAEQFKSSDIGEFFCSVPETSVRYKISEFQITKFSMPALPDWKTKFKEGFENYLVELGIWKLLKKEKPEEKPEEIPF